MIITPCVREKLTLPFKLPACLRYKSGSIKRLTAAACWSDEPFYILSGRYGLLSPWDMIPYYDQPLKRGRVNHLVAGVVRFLGRMNPNKVVFYWDELDQDSRPYLTLIQEACLQLRIPFKAKPLNSSRSEV